jgi:aldehyde dehydrogenase
MSNAINETLIREIVEQVIGRILPTAPGPSPASRADAPRPPLAGVGSRGARSFGVFADAESACEAASVAQEQLREAGVAGRRKVVELVKGLCTKNAEPWGRIELDETKIGRLDHKIDKLRSIERVPGCEMLYPQGVSGDHGITLEELTPFGVIGAVTPSTHSIPTVACNIISMVAAGNSVVFNAHPSACRCASMATRVFNEAIYRELGIENLACIIEAPTLESFQGICKNDHVRLICVTGGPAVVRAAFGFGKRAICAGPGNPPVLVDETADIDKAARDIIRGASYDNNLLCIGEKEVFVVEAVAGKLMEALRRAGAHELSSAQIDRLAKAAFVFPPGQGAGCAHASVNRDLVGRDAAVLAKIAGTSVPSGTDLLFGETDERHLFVREEQMMPFLPIVRVRDVCAGIAAAKAAEHGYKHTSIIHSRNVRAMTNMARALDTTIFVKNGPCMAGLGLGGEGYPSFTIATPTGEAVTSPRTFARVRRCAMVDDLRIY